MGARKVNGNQSRKLLEKSWHLWSQNLSDEIVEPIGTGSFRHFLDSSHMVKSFTSLKEADYVVKLVAQW